MDLLDSQLASELIDQGLASGADFVDIFVEKTESESLSFKSQKIKDIQNNYSYGLGIRLVRDEESYYAYSNILEKDSLKKLVGELGENIKKEQKTMLAIEKIDQPLPQLKMYSTIEKPFEERLQTLKRLDQKIRAGSSSVSQVDLSYFLKNQKVQIFNSLGLNRSEERPYARLLNAVVASSAQGSSRAFHGPGGRGGFTFIESLDLDEISEIVVKRSLTLLGAAPCPAGTMPVVIDNGFGGVIFHEACGHSLETTAVEKKASVFWDKMGEEIAHPSVSAVDDGAIDFLWGSLGMDDEGMNTQRTQLIKNGVLTRFISDMMGERKTGHLRTGSARRQSYRYAPASRMRNTFIEAGPHTLAEMIGTVPYGLYAKTMGGGSVNPSTGEFNFAVEEAYMIRDGKISEAVKGATLIGKGEEILKRISMVGKNLAYAAGMCGSVSGSLPVTVGQPALKVDSIVVGGQA